MAVSGLQREWVCGQGEKDGLINAISVFAVVVVVVVVVWLRSQSRASDEDVYHLNYRCTMGMNGPC